MHCLINIMPEIKYTLKSLCFITKTCQSIYKNVYDNMQQFLT